MSETNILTKTASDKHAELLREGEYDFLTPTTVNEKTFMLGYLEGVKYYAEMNLKALNGNHSYSGILEIREENVVLSRNM